MTEDLLADQPHDSRRCSLAEQLARIQTTMSSTRGLLVDVISVHADYPPLLDDATCMMKVTVDLLAQAAASEEIALRRMRERQGQ